MSLKRPALTPGEPNVIMNTSVNLTSSLTEEERSDLDLVIVIFTSLILGLMILTTIIGKRGKNSKLTPTLDAFY